MEPPSHQHRPTRRGREPDGLPGDVIVEVMAGVHALRSLRDRLLHLSSILADHPGRKGILVLVDPGISDARLSRERRSILRVLHPDIAGRLAIATTDGRSFRGLPEDSGPELEESLLERLRLAALPGKAKRGTRFEVLRVLVHQWLLGRGPMTSLWLGRTVGCSHPTVASALRLLGNQVERTSDRRVGLRRFPVDAWARLLAVADDVRGTMRYRDASGQPRSPEDLLERLRRLGRGDVGVGGVLGARHYDPDIDLVGASRLDLTWHCRTGSGPPDFVAKLDPALKAVTEPGGPAGLVVHVLRRADPLFQPDGSGAPWADPVECLLDLQEARMVHQAEEFVEHMRGSRTGAP